MKTSTIQIDVKLNEEKVPQQISWSATDSTQENMQPAEAMMINFWDAADKAALRIDLWTGKMMIDEMVDFYYQTFMGMADTLQRSTGQQALCEDLRKFAHDFTEKFKAQQRKANA